MIYDASAVRVSSKPSKRLPRHMVFSSLGLTVYWAFSFEDDCHGPVYHSRYESCVVRLDAERSKFQEEIIAISNRFQVNIEYQLSIEWNIS